MFRVHHAALFAATVTLMSSACGGAAPTGGNGQPGVVETDLAALCASACDNVRSGQCGDTNPNCESDCESAADDFPRLCLDKLKAVFACYAEQTAVCTGEHEANFPACAQRLVDLTACVQAHVETDATYGGRCLPSSSTPENSAERCGDLEQTPLLYECTGGPPRAGCVADPAEGADLYCCPEL